MASAMATKIACASSALKNNFSCGDGNHNILGRRCRRQLLRERSGCLLCVHAVASADGDGGVCENRDAVRSGKVLVSTSSSRRQALAFATFSAVSAVLISSQPAQARDVPLFGFRKVQKQVVDEVKELVKEGEAEAQAVTGAVSGMVKTAVADFSVPSSSSKASSSEGGGLSPALQAGVVAGAELVAVLVASTVVNGLVSPSK
ncbi:unnamed protein product [Sphagnum troendelagicum]|uniref:Uncharacterized protein n=1 Tax=Sphagnum troendelagicum TaxID=128251 RepID=A0ABP0TGR9_9BRYO